MFCFLVGFLDFGIIVIIGGMCFHEQEGNILSYVLTLLY